MSVHLGVSAKGVTASGTSVATPAVRTTPGSLLAVFAQWEETGTFVSVADNYSNPSWQPLAAELHYGASRTRAWYHENIAGGVGHQVTVAIDVATPITVFLLEATGAALSSALDGLPDRIESVTPPWVSPTVTVSEAASILLGCHFEFGAGGYYFHTADNGFLKVDEEIDGAVYFPGVSLYRMAGAVGAVTTSVTTDNDVNVASAVGWLLGVREAQGAIVSELVVGLS